MDGWKEGVQKKCPTASSRHWQLRHHQNERHAESTDGDEEKSGTRIWKPNFIFSVQICTGK